MHTARFRVRFRASVRFMFRVTVRFKVRVIVRFSICSWVSVMFRTRAMARV